MCGRGGGNTVISYLLSSPQPCVGEGGGIHNTENSLEKQNMNGLEQIDLRDFYF